MFNDDRIFTQILNQNLNNSNIKELKKELNTNSNDVIFLKNINLLIMLFFYQYFLI